MIDINIIRRDPEMVKAKSLQKGYEVDIDRILKLDQAKNKLLTDIEDLRHQRKELSNLSEDRQKPTEESIQQSKELKRKIVQQEEQYSKIELELDQYLRKIPNLPLQSVPVGKSETENKVIRKVGDIPVFDFEVKSHAEIAEAKDWLDKKRAAKVAGSRFNYVKNGLVKLQFALINFVIDNLSSEEVIKKIITENNLKLDPKPFIPIIPPALIRTSLYEDSARLDAEEVTYKIEQDDLWLNASAEHSLCVMYQNEILAKSELPIRYIGYSTSFRREAGSYGKDMEGMFRSHQFDKLEMEVFSAADHGLDEHLLLIAIEEYLMQALKLPYQVLEKCTADIGFPNAKGVDIECWLPSQKTYRETHSADYMTDFQARRLKTRYRNTNDEIEYVHTNDATAIPMSRIPIAILENYQTKDGEVLIPEILQPYLQNKRVL
jgi:seryl-tRNA synthetase